MPIAPIRLLVSAWLLLLLAGCSTTVNRVPRGQPRGYVEFRPAGHFGGRIGIEETSEDGWTATRLGDIGYTTRTARLKAALSAGEHRFSVRLGSAHRLVKVNVVQDCVTPVLVQISDHSQRAEYLQGGGTIVHHQFRMVVTAEEPWPCTEASS